ncbi:response regulator [Azospirillum sp. A39]|uniref:response regulator n=1 Tax=Azospirillum sp. A39 TaxID=3462279 RepID=UPI0040455198
MASILVVDDAPKVRRAIRRSLEVEGHAVIEAGDAGAARQRLAAGGVELALVDIWMPGDSGLELMRGIKAVWPDLPVIVMSGGGPQAPIEYSLAVAEAEGAAAVLVKPFEDDQLLAAVAAALVPA